MEDAPKAIKIMVIDDSKTIRRTAETLLQKKAIPWSRRQTALKHYQK